MKKITNHQQQQILTLIKDYHDFNPPKISLKPWPTPLEFSKQINKSVPCVYSLPNNPEIFKCPALNWTRNSMINLIGQETKLEVAVTPDGRADSLHTLPGTESTEGTKGEEVFLEPATQQMTLDELFLHLYPNTTKKDQEVYYLQSQNSNLTQPNSGLSPLVEDIPSDIPFANPVLGEPEAINLWIGDSRSVTSIHRDPYENLYLVISGTKIFTLWAPVEEYLLSSVRVRTGKYVINPKGKGFDVELSPEDEEGKIPWIPIDPLLPREELNRMYPLYRYARPLSVKVRRGQMLYLPAGWFHHVCQEIEEENGMPCIAVNYWYDQEYEGEKFVMRSFISRLSTSSSMDLN